MARIVRCPSCGAESRVDDVEPDAADESLGRAAIDRDRTAETRDRAAERRDRGAEDRDALAGLHERALTDRERIGSDQDQESSDHDRTASGGDQRTADADQRAADADFAAGGDAATHTRGALARSRTRRDRGSAAVSREETTVDRRQTRDHNTSGVATLAVAAELDRQEAAGDRKEAGQDREAASGDRHESLRERTEFAAAAERAVGTLESMSDAFFTVDSEWRFTYLNPQTEAILERRRRDLIGKSVWEEFPEAVGSRFDDQYRRAVREQVPVRFEEAFEPLGRTFEVRAYPVPDGLAVYFSDVTAERMNDERLRQAQRLEAIGRVAAGVAHDFNNLLTVVRGYAHLGQAASADETTTLYFSEIESAGEKAVEMTRQLLAFGREQDLAPAGVDLSGLIEGLSSVLGQLLPPGIELRFALSPQPAPVFVDRSQLERVLVNLVVNSRDAIETTGSIVVSTGTTDDLPAGVLDIRGPSAWLQVADSGCGIAADVMPHIFDPFFSTKPRETGTGLGLATIYGIVSQSGGSIFVDSTPGAGTTVTIALPARAPVT